MCPEFDGASHVGDRPGGGLGEAGSLANGLVADSLTGEGVARFPDKEGSGSDGGEGYPGGLNGIAVQLDGNTGAYYGYVHLVAGDEADVASAGVGCGGGNADGDEELIGSEDSLPGPRAHFLYGYTAGAIWPGDICRGAIGYEGGYGVGAGSGITEVAAHGGPALNLDTSDDGGAIHESWVVFFHSGIFVNLVAPHRSTDCEPGTGVVGKLIELGDRLGVQEDVGLATPGAKLDEDVGATGEGACAVTVFGEDVKGLAERRGVSVVDPFQMRASFPSLTRDRLSPGLMA